MGPVRCKGGEEGPNEQLLEDGNQGRTKEDEGDGRPLTIVPMGTQYLIEKYASGYRVIKGTKK
jgi:hypothetical protein